jgi:hypothetical protein
MGLGVGAWRGGVAAAECLCLGGMPRVDGGAGARLRSGVLLAARAGVTWPRTPRPHRRWPAVALRWPAARPCLPCCAGDTPIAPAAAAQDLSAGLRD